MQRRSPGRQSGVAVLVGSVSVMRVEFLASGNLWQPSLLLLHGMMGVSRLFIINLPLLFVPMLMVAVYSRMRDEFVQKLR